MPQDRPLYDSDSQRPHPGIQLLRRTTHRHRHRRPHLKTRTTQPMRSHPLGHGVEPSGSHARPQRRGSQELSEAIMLPRPPPRIAPPPYPAMPLQPMHFSLILLSTHYSYFNCSFTLQKVGNIELVGEDTIVLMATHGTSRSTSTPSISLYHKHSV